MAITGKGDNPFKSAWAKSKTRRSRFGLLYENNPLGNESVAVWDDFLFEASQIITETEFSSTLTTSALGEGATGIAGEGSAAAQTTPLFGSSTIAEGEGSVDLTTQTDGQGLAIALSEFSDSSSGLVNGESSLIVEAETSIQALTSIYGEKVLTVSGIVKNTSNTPQANCPVKLFSASDDSLVDETTSDVTGYYEFVDPAGEPFYAASFSPDNTLAGITVPTLIAA